MSIWSELRGVLGIAAALAAMVGAPARADVVIHSGDKDPVTEGWNLGVLPNSSVAVDLGGAVETIGGTVTPYWRVNDRSTTGFKMYWLPFATAMRDQPWQLSSRLRVGDSPIHPLSNVGPTSLIVNDGLNYWSFYIDNTGVGPLGSSGSTYAARHNIDTRSAYRTYTIRFSPNGPGTSDDTANFLVDGAPVFTDVGRAALFASPPTSPPLGDQFVWWGPGGSLTLSDANYASVEFRTGSDLDPLRRVRPGQIAINIDGAVSALDAARGVDLGRFDLTTGLGEILISLDAAGRRRVSLFADHELDATTNSLTNEIAASARTPASGQTWEIDEPGFGGRTGGYFGDIFANFERSALDQLLLQNRPDATVGLLPEDIAMALGWDFDLAPGEAARLRFLLSLTEPADGFYLVHRDPDSELAIYLSATLERFAVEPPSDVPAPSSALLLLPALAFLGLWKRATLVVAA